MKNITKINVAPTIKPSRKPLFGVFVAFIKLKTKNSIILPINKITAVMPLFTPNKFNKLVIKVNISSIIIKILINFK